MMIRPDDGRTADGDDGAAAVTQPQTPTLVVQCCPFCGDAVGSYFGDRAIDGTRWCESCGVDFLVTVVAREDAT